MYYGDYLHLRRMGMSPLAAYRAVYREKRMPDSAETVFNEERSYLALVKLEADSEEHAEELVTGALSAAWAVGSFQTTYDVLCAVRDGGDIERIDFVDPDSDDDSERPNDAVESVRLR